MSHAENLQWLATSPFAGAVALIERGYVIRPAFQGLDAALGNEVEQPVYLSTSHPVARWEYWAKQALAAAEAGCPVQVELDCQCDIWLYFAGSDVWQ